MVPDWVSGHWLIRESTAGIAIRQMEPLVAGTLLYIAIQAWSLVAGTPQR
jgi:hypothetical protein